MSHWHPAKIFKIRKKSKESGRSHGSPWLVKEHSLPSGLPHLSQVSSL
jgi:hypothetical protein